LVLGLIAAAWAWNLSRTTPRSTREAITCDQVQLLLRPRDRLLSKATSDHGERDHQTRDLVEALEWFAPITDVPRSVAPSFRALYAYVDGVAARHQPSESVRLKAVAAIGPIQHWAHTCKAER
jgi:hypothetical protein